MYILHTTPTTQRSWNHPKIVFAKLKMLCPSCYMMKEWSDNKQQKMTIMHEINKLMPHMNLIVNGEVNQAYWKVFKK